MHFISHCTCAVPTGLFTAPLCGRVFTAPCVLVCLLGKCRAAPILVSVSVLGQYQHFFDSIRVGQVHYTSTSSVVHISLNMKGFFQNCQAEIIMKKI